MATVTIRSDFQFSSVSSVSPLCPTLCDPMNRSMPGFHVHHQLPRVHLDSCPLSQWCHSTISSSVILFSRLHLSQHQGLFKWVSSSHQVAKVLGFQLQHQSFQWMFRTDFFRMDWLDLLAVQGTLKSLLQYHSSKASILWHSAFFMVQLSHPYMTSGETIIWLDGPLLAKWCLCFLISCLVW